MKRVSHNGANDEKSAGVIFRPGKEWSANNVNGNPLSHKRLNAVCY